MKNNIFIIVAPNYRKNFAGVRTLYKLALDLKNNNCISFIVNWKCVNDYISPILDIPVLQFNIALDIVKYYNAIVIYPEVVKGNPLKAKRVVRWLLNIPGVCGGDGKYDKTDKLFSYSKLLTKQLEKKYEIISELTTPTIDVDLFNYDESIEKTDITVYTGKQQFREGIIDKFDNLITRTSPSHEEVAKILKRIKVLYTFDCLTNIVNEARLCGCEVVYIPNDQQVLDIDGNEYGPYGLHKLSNLSKLKFDYEKIASEMQKNIKLLNDRYLEQLKFMIENFKNN